MNTLILLTIISVATASVIIKEPLPDKEKFPSKTDVNEFPYIDGPEILPEARAHHLFIGRCGSNDTLLHSETIIINNDGTSRAVGDIRINVDGPVHITCVKVLNKVGEDGISGAYPSYLAGGVGHNYVILGFRCAYGYSANFYIELYGYDK